MKFAQNLNKKQLKLFSGKNSREKTVFLSHLAAHSPPVHCAVVTSRRSLCGPACDSPSAYLTRAASCWPSDEIRWTSVSVAGSKTTALVE
jgi:hypothetical protein